MNTILACLIVALPRFIALGFYSFILFAEITCCIGFTVLILIRFILIYKATNELI